MIVVLGFAVSRVNERMSERARREDSLTGWDGVELDAECVVRGRRPGRGERVRRVRLSQRLLPLEPTS